jgi:tetratricopeptide (TPR) repeat protein
MNHRYGQATATSNLGPLYSRLGQHDLAISQLEEALRIFRETNHRYGEASVLNGLGDALHVAGRPGALQAHMAALEIATETGDWDEQAIAHTGATRICLSLGEVAKARHHAEQALKLNSPAAEEIRALLAEMER